MRVILAVTVANLYKASHLRPASGWGHPFLTYMIRLRCHECSWISMPIPIRVSSTIRRGTKYFNAITTCEGCGNIGTVRILQTMGTPIVRPQVPMPVMVLEVMGLALDYTFVDFAFNWTILGLIGGRWDRIPPFALLSGSYVVSMDESLLAHDEYPPSVVDVEGFYMPTY